MTTRPGAVSVAELVLALTFFALIAAGAGEFLVGSSRLASAQRDDLRMAELVRTARVVLAGELRLIAAADLASTSADSVRVRAFRGGGTVCGGAGAEVWLRYAGLRAPDPTKDSVVLIGRSGSEEALAVEGVAAAPCGAGAVALTLSGTPAAVPGYGLLFEAGAYHVAGGALRYRRGAGGRQPLTESLLLAPTFARAGPDRFELDLRPDPDSIPHGGARSWPVRIRRLNAGGAP